MFGMAQQLAHIRQRIAEANEAYQGDDEGLRAEICRIAEEVGLPPEMGEAKFDSIEAVVGHLVDTQMHVLEQMAAMQDQIERLSLMVIGLVEGIASGTGKQWCRRVIEAADVAEKDAEKDFRNFSENRL